ncbi:TlpA family protein disulfide reductase [Mageeibacillus indolicus]|uniref:Antioxidant, AhpC/TSA family n=2 Tax=Mageeibacillus indolicus TaxID=884684 RepID=D3R353_MAGIU|nr:TlpA disulfide reductase family protein [Mageeibacillus indolicus]ADC91028.1 antioxidant, AhpC/TSA family [Mageeibacillus indolicus UPII9-5]PNH18089.1 hypothetical protein B7R76_07085 [Mageeibacillus indolicus]
MRRQIKYLILVIFILFIFGSGYYYYRNNTVTPPSAAAPGSSEAAMQADAAAGKPLDPPDMFFSDVENTVKHLSEYKGKVVILNFWASWCSVCDAEMPDFNKLYEKYKSNSQVQFLPVAVVDGQRETVEKAKNYMKAKGFGLPLFFDLQGQMFNSIGLPGLPVTLIFNKDGRLISIAPYTEQTKPYYVHVGAMPGDLLEKIIEGELAK